ncbi:conserved hypothetical protein [Alcanivorax sp. DSM 26293]|uniref:DUF2459 domain-containing protein n=1 Tax=unclassified Alcanivorax TaxID=2638842 RepID=UPI0008A04963|nr:MULTISPECIES: DUF2459 domain-containing protein [unclassified Alcanivorax]MEE3388777.1 DUF2459 domain-containing protein [Pseudomonadota bacterium]SEF95548.1 conserved hypothetical protein [Alcanivorax sp. DSM 26293]
MAWYTVAMMRLWAISLTVVLALPAQALADDVTVLVVRHRWHTGIAFPADRLSPALGFLEPHFSEPSFYEFGWGDDAFYRQDDSWWLRVRAMLWPTRSAMHVVGLERHPELLPHTDLQPLCLSAEQLGQLQESLAGYFQLDEQGRLPAGDPGLYGDSRFFPSNDTFWFSNTCNTWTARRLREAGLPIRAFLTLTAGQVLGQLREGNQAGACATR